MTKIAIITTDYNNHPDTLEWLKSIKTLDTKDLELLTLVVDNGSDTSVKNTIDKFKGVVWLQTGKNLGFAGGFNHGLCYAMEWGAQYFLIINNDTLFNSKNLLHQLIEVLEDNPQAGIVSPKIMFAPGYEFYKNKYKKSDLGKIIWYAGGEFDWGNIRSVHRGIDEIDRGQFNLVENTSYVSGCCLLVKREVIEKVGLFEEKLFAYYEDADWLERIKKAGFKLWYSGMSNIYHKVSRTSGIGSPWSDYLITRNRLWFGFKYAGLRTKFAILRQAARILLTGRPAQKEGVIDYFSGIWGWKQVKTPDSVEYPLELSVIIINYRTTSFTIQLLKSIFDPKSGLTEIPDGTEVIVLDNSPEAPCREEVLKMFPRIKFISNSVNNGFSKGNNQLISYSQGKYVLLLNSDIEIKPSSLNHLIAAANKFGDRAVYSGKLFFSGGEVQDSCFKLPTPWRAFQQYFLNQPGSYFMFKPDGNKPTRVEGTVMACFLIPRLVINEIGKLAEASFMYFEDIEYCRRCRDHHIPVYFVPDAQFIHHHGQASKQAGLDLSNQRLIEAAKWYHGGLNYYLIVAILWLGQKLGRVKTPQARWKHEK